MINHAYEVSKASVRINVVSTHCPGASSCKEIANHELNYDISFCGENTVKYVQIEDRNSK